MTGFWVLIPLAMLSFTGAWISFPKVFGQFESRARHQPAANREQAMRARPLGSPGAHRRCRRHRRPAPRDRRRWPASPGRPIRRPNGKSVLRARAAMPSCRSTMAPPRPLPPRRRSPKRSPAPCAAGTTAPAWACPGRSSSSSAASSRLCCRSPAPSSGGARARPRPEAENHRRRGRPCSRRISAPLQPRASRRPAQG